MRHSHPSYQHIYLQILLIIHFSCFSLGMPWTLHTTFSGLLPWIPILALPISLLVTFILEVLSSPGIIYPVWYTAAFLYSSQGKNTDWTELMRATNTWFGYLMQVFLTVQFSSVHSVMSSSLQSHGLQHTRLPCPSPTPAAYSNSCP